MLRLKLDDGLLVATLIVTVTFNCAPELIEPVPLVAPVATFLSIIKSPVVASSMRYLVIQSPVPTARTGVIDVK